ncbi:MAG TPA: GNAT family N-acetyltransferase [Roseiflexaceae bacterium]|jgi:GNAT superfamily N-acetyltransferase|nr:GNAT family N-acetyltransferase [Roseiflexaceae bacterium]
MDITTRLAQPEDQEHLYQVYRSMRLAEVTAWGWTEQMGELFLHSQFDAQQRHFATEGQGFERRVILRDGEPAGSLVVARTSEMILLAFIAVLPQFYGLGTGTVLVNALMDEARRVNKPLVAHGLHGSRSKDFFAGLGFIDTGADELYWAVEWRG